MGWRPTKQQELEDARLAALAAEGVERQRARVAAAQAIVDLTTGGPGGSSFPLTEDVSADGHTISDLADPVADGDAVPKSYADGVAGGVLTATAVLSSAEVLDLEDTPVEVTPAPVAGKMIVPLQVVFTYLPGTAIYGTAITQLLLVTTVQEYTVESNGGIWGQSARAALPRFTVPVSSLMIADDDISVAGADGQALAIVSDESLALGPVLASSLNNGGSGYVVGDLFVVDGVETRAEGIVDTVDGGGAVLTYHLTANGELYTAPTVGAATINTGGPGNIGTGLTIDVDSVTQGDGTLSVTTVYVLVDAP